MKKLTSWLLFICLGLTANAALAHSDHEHKHETPAISVSQAAAVALDTAKLLTESDKGLGFGQLPESWSRLSSDQANIKKQTNDYFIVSVTNNAENKTLFILISAQGEAYDANFTGKFDGLDSE